MFHDQIKYSLVHSTKEAADENQNKQTKTRLEIKVEQQAVTLSRQVDEHEYGFRPE